MRNLIVLGLVGLFMGCQPKPTETAETDNHTPTAAPNKYMGEWESTGAENLGNGTFANRYFKLGEEDWEIQFTLYLDSLKASPVFMFKATGKYEVDGASSIVGGADNAIFHFGKKHLTLLTDNAELIGNFGFATCGLEQGTAKDITADGCSFLVSNAVCGQEYDLLKLDGDLLYFGMRPAAGEDMCSEAKRPTALFYPVKKKS